MESLFNRPNLLSFPPNSKKTRHIRFQISSVCNEDNKYMYMSLTQHVIACIETAVSVDQQFRAVKTLLQSCICSILTASVGVCILRYHLLENMHKHDMFYLVTQNQK